MPPPQPSQPAPPPEDEDDDLFDRLPPAALLARGLKTPVEPVPPAPKQPTALLAELFGEYRIAGELSHGGFGIVYRAEHRKLKRRMALKILSHTLTSNAAAVARFEREIEAVGKLDHPGIVRAFDAGERGGVWFLAMEFIEGMDLARLTKTLGPLAPADAAEIARQAALALHYAHGHGLIHRDVKPSNIMLALPPPDSSPLSLHSPPTVKVLDFGLAQLNAADPAGLTISADFLGTVDYIAPEQVENPRAADPRSDLYGLGATLHLLLTGLAPHEQPDSQETLLQKLTHVAHHDAAPVRTRRAEIPEGLAALVDSLLQRDPALRPQSAAAVVEALTPFCEGADLAALAARAAASEPPLEWPAPGKTVNLQRRKSRHWMLASGAVAAVALGAGFWLGNRAPQSPGPDAGLFELTRSTAPAVLAPAAPVVPDGPAQFIQSDFVQRMSVPEGGVCRMVRSDTWVPWWGDHLSGSAWLAWVPRDMPREQGASTARWLLQSRTEGVLAQHAVTREDLTLASLPDVFTFSGDGRTALWAEKAAPGILHAAPFVLHEVPELSELGRFTLPLPPGTIVRAIVAPPPDWKGPPALSSSHLLVLDSAAAIHLCSMENHIGVIDPWPAPSGGLPVDAAFSPRGLFLLVPPAERTDFTPVPADTNARLYRRVGSSWTACTTDLPLTDPCALAADPRPEKHGELLVLCGHLQPADAPGARRFLARLIPDGTDRYRVEIIAENFIAPAPGGLEISPDGARLVVADKGAKVWYGWRTPDASPGW